LLVVLGITVYIVKEQGDDDVWLKSIEFEMSYEYSGKKLKFYEDFYAVTIVSYIYYEEEKNEKEAIFQGNADNENI
jgi:hypothetical protein